MGHFSISKWESFGKQGLVLMEGRPTLRILGGEKVIQKWFSHLEGKRKNQIDLRVGTKAVKTQR